MGVLRLLPLGPPGSALCHPLLVGGPRDKIHVGLFTGSSIG